MHDKDVHDGPCFHATCTLLVVYLSLERQLIGLATGTWMPEAPISTSVEKGGSTMRIAKRYTDISALTSAAGSVQLAHNT